MYRYAELDNFALTVASDLLLSGPQAYFHESLLESGLGSGFAPGTGYSGSRRETSFAVGLKSVADADVEEVEKRVVGLCTSRIQLHGSFTSPSCVCVPVSV